MSNEITIVVKSRDEAAPGFDSATTRTDRLGTSAKQAGTKLDDLSAAFELAKVKGDWFSRVANGDANAADFLKDHIAGLRQETARLTEEFNRTGNTTILSKIFDNNKIEKDLSDLRSKITKTLDDTGQQAAPSFWQKLMAAGSEAAAGSGGSGIAGPLIAAAVVASPLIAAAINSALIAGIGMGGIATGIIGQLHNAAVRDAFSDMGHDLLDALAKDTSAFAQPLIGAAHLLGNNLKDDLGSIDFSTLAKDIIPLVDGLSGLVNRMLPGFNEALRDSQPLLDELDNDLPLIGAAISDFFHEIAGGKGNLEGLRVLLMLVAGGFELLGRTLGILSNIFHGVVVVGDDVTAFLSHMGVLLGPVANLAGVLHRAFAEVRGGVPSVTMLGRSLVDLDAPVANVEDDLANLNKQIDAVNITTSQVAAHLAQKMFSALMAVDQGTLSWHQALTQLHDSLQQHGKDLRETTANGQANVSAIFAAVTANMQLYQAQVAAGMSAKDAATAYDANEKALEKQLRAMGISQPAIDQLIGKYRGIPDAASGATATMDDLRDSIDRLVDSIRTLMGLPNSKEIRVNVTAAVGGGGAVGSAIAGMFSGHAAGGVASGFGQVAEYGRELARLPGGQYAMLPPGSQVYSHPDTERMLSGRGSSVPSPTFSGWVGPGADSAIASLLQRLQATGQLRFSSSN